VISSSTIKIILFTESALCNMCFGM